jgi:hypothetical protein
LLLFLAGSAVDGQQTRTSIGQGFTKANRSVKVFVDSRLAGDWDLQIFRDGLDDVGQEVQLFHEKSPIAASLSDPLRTA